MPRKKVLMIAPKYFGYEDIIRDAICQRGADVKVLFENRETVSFWHRFVYFYMPAYKERMLERYYAREIGKTGRDFDIVLIIRGSSVSKRTIEYMKKNFPPHCRFVMYQWDSVQNNTNAREIADRFDDILTFDPLDAERFGWKYRPLFFCRDRVRPPCKDIDITYICSLHSERAEILRQLKRMCKERSLVLYDHMYVKGFLFCLGKYIKHNPKFTGVENGDVKFKKLSVRDTYALYSRSRIVVDYTNPGQNGLTMRTIECMGCGCKLVTNNASVRNADFYDQQNILVYEGTKLEIPQAFLQQAYRDPDPSVRAYYSLDRWVEDVLGDVLP